MKIQINTSTCVITREPNDPKYYGTVNAKGESNLLHAIKTKLNALGYDFIKKRMWKDGHMVDDMQQYLRERKPVNGRQLCIYNDAWAIQGANDPYNEQDVVTLTVHDMHR